MLTPLRTESHEILCALCYTGFVNDHYKTASNAAGLEKNQNKARARVTKWMKERQKMDWITGISQAIDYVEDHITEPVNYEEAAKCAYSSSFHFQRVFSVVCGFTLGDYVRFRRLALAGRELAAENAKVIDIAMKYGYDTPESFSRAFTRFHGCTPTQAKKGAVIKSFSRLSVKLIVSGGTKMDYRIEKKDAFDVLVKRKRFTKNKEINGQEITAFWGQCTADGTIDRITRYVHSDNVFKDSIIGIALEYLPGDEDFPYGIGCHYNGEPVTDEDLEVVSLPAASYAVFPCRGAMPEAFQKVYKYIFEEFFLNSEYQPSGVEIEAYPSANATDPDYYWELWLAVKKK